MTAVSVQARSENWTTHSLEQDSRTGSWITWTCGVAIFRELSKKTSGVRRPGSAALDLAYVACGRFDGFWESGPQVVGYRRGCAAGSGVRVALFLTFMVTRISLRQEWSLQAIHTCMMIWREL